MRAFLSRHAAAIYIGGGIAFVLGVAGVGFALSAASLAGAAIGGALSASGLAAMGCTSRSVGA